ncbi:MAG: RNA polymerase sigma factor [Clostridia bacterium]|nr:RNA polymerase sigma factor [Clostridia bacterium]
MENNEDNIIKKAQNGDNDSFEKLIELFQDRAFAIAYSVMGNYHDSYDMVQESFIKAYNNIHKFNFKSSFNTWLFRIIKNTCIDEIRKRNRRKTISIDSSYENDDGELSFQLEDDADSLETILEKKENSELLTKALEKLSIEHRTVVVLSDIEGYDYKEISELLEINLGTVKSRISRARIKLAEIIRNDGTF